MERRIVPEAALSVRSIFGAVEREHGAI